MPYTYAVTSHSQADPGGVFALLVDARTWPTWSPVDAAEVEGGNGQAGPQQVGDTRVFHTGRAVSRERITGLDPGRRLSYETVGGQFFRSYHGLIELTETPPGGTDITWSATFEPKLPLSGPFWTWYLTRFQQRMADGLAHYASQTRHQNTT
jgi:hypothetical protein